MACCLIPRQRAVSSASVTQEATIQRRFIKCSDSANQAVGSHVRLVHMDGGWVQRRHQKYRSHRRRRKALRDNFSRLDGDFFLGLLQDGESYDVGEARVID